MNARRAALVLQVVAVTALALVAVSGHGPGAGTMLLAVSMTHGVNSGDLLVVALWLVSVVVSLLVWRERPRR